MGDVDMDLPEVEPYSSDRPCEPFQVAISPATSVVDRVFGEINARLGIDLSSIMARDQVLKVGPIITLFDLPFSFSDT